MKLLIFKLLIATTCIPSPSPCHDLCGTVVVNQACMSVVRAQVNALSILFNNITLTLCLMIVGDHC